jgi:hypothetical protein
MPIAQKLVQPPSKKTAAWKKPPAAEFLSKIKNRELVLVAALVRRARCGATATAPVPPRTAPECGFLASLT